MAAPDFEDPDRGGDNEYSVTLGISAGGHTITFDVAVTVTNKEEGGALGFSSPQPQAGADYTATLSDLDGVQSTTWTWERSTSRNGPWGPVSRAILDSIETSVYTPDTDDVGYFLRVTAAYTDGHGPNKSRVLVSANTVKAAPVTNDPPSFDEPTPTRSIAENARARAAVGRPVTATDPNSGDVLTYELSGSDLFTIDSNGGQIRVAADESLDHETAPSHRVTVTASDSSTASDTVTVTITVDDVNEPPTAEGDSADTPEDTEVTIDVVDNDSDPEDERSALTLLVATPPRWGSLVVNASANPGDRPTITYTPRKDYNGADSFEYRLRDTGGLTDTALVAVQIDAVNDAPEFPPGPTTRSVPEDARANDIVGAPVVAADAEHAGQLTYTLTGGSDLFTIDGGSGQIRVAADESLDRETAPSHSVVVTATDPSLAFDTVQVTIDVTNVNEPPNAVADAPGRFDEDTSIEIRVLDNDSDPEDERSELLLTVVTPPSNGSATVNEPAGQNRTITYEPNANYHGADSFTYQVTDSGGLSSTARVTVQITPVNDAPEFATDMTTRTVSEGAGPGDTVGTKVAATDVDDITLTYRLSGASDFVIDASGPTAGQIRVAPGVTLDRESTPSYNATVTADDGKGGTDSIDVTINVSDVPEPPTAVNDTAMTAEDTRVNIDVLANDTDPDTEKANLMVSVRTQPLNGRARAQSDQTITYTPNANFAGENSFTYRLSDGQFTDDGSVSVTVVAVNDAPTFFPTTAARSVPEDAEAGDNVGPPVTATDVDNDTCSPTSLSGADASSFEIDSGSGQITVASGTTFDIAMKPTYTVTVDADDGTARPQRPSWSRSRWVVLRTSRPLAAAAAAASQAVAVVAAAAAVAAAPARAWSSSSGP